MQLIKCLACVLCAGFGLRASAVRDLAVTCANRETGAIKQSFGAAPRHVYPRYMEPREHPDESRRSVKPPDRAAFGNRLQFTSLRQLRGGDAWRADIASYVYSNRLGNVIWPHIGCLNHARLPEIVAYIKSHDLWLFDLWGFVPGNGDKGPWHQYKRPPGVTEMFARELGDRWLGMDNGEQDGRWSGSFSGGFTPYGADRLQRYYHFQRHFERLHRLLGNRMAGLVSLNFGHYFLKENCYTLLGAETAQALPNSQVYYAFIRGAGKQYGVPWFGNVSIYSHWGWKCYPKTVDPKADHGPEKGPSLALMKKLLYAQMFYNALVCGFEGAYFDGNGALSPIGRIQREAVDWSARHGDPGVMQTPVALMTDFFAGWSFPRYLYSGYAYRVWGNVPYEAGDYLTDGVLDMIYPGYVDSAFYRDERGFNTPTPYGDIADCLLSDAPGWLLARYPLLVLAGAMRPSAELADNLAAYVAQGGHLVLTRGNVKRLFAKGLPAAANGGRVTVIPSEWGIVEKPVCPVPEYRAWEKDLAKPYPLAAETRRILDAAFREQALFDLKGGERLSVITCRRGKGDYTLAVLNNAWCEQPLSLVSHVGRIRSVEELPTDGAEKTALGFWPSCVTNRVPGADTPATIAAGAVRMLRVSTDETPRDVVELAHATPPANPKGRMLYLRSMEKIKEQVLARPTFFRHWDSVMVDWRYVFDRDDEALDDERNWIDLQGLGVAVDFSSGLDLFPTYRFVDNDASETARSKAAFAKLIGKCARLGVKTIVIRRHRLIEDGAQRRAAVAQFFDGVRDFCAKAAEKGIDVVILDSKHSPGDAAKVVAQVGAKNLSVGSSLESGAGGTFRFLGMSERDPMGVVTASSVGRLAASQRKDLPALLRTAQAQGACLVFNALYAGPDDEYRDAQFLENVK